MFEKITYPLFNINMNTVIQKIESDEILQKVSAFNNNVYLVGGCIRDFILGKENFDKDIVIDIDNVKEYAQKLAEKLEATFVVLDDENKIYRLVLKDKVNTIDVAGVIGNNIEEDLRRRDFTINSVGVNLKTMQILDINNGLEDIKNKSIRWISEKNLHDDPLRILRAFRFQASLGFEIEPDLLEYIKTHYKDLDKIAIERINAELIKLFEGKYADKTLLDMGELIEYFFPIMAEVKKIPTNSHHHLPLFLHSIETVKQVQKIYDNADEKLQTQLKARLGLLKISAFLHDIGKPETWTIEGDRHRFIKHDDIGAKLVVPILKALNFSKKQIAYISMMIKFHIYPAQVVTPPNNTTRSYTKLVRNMEDNTPDILVLSMSDRLSALGPSITKEIVDNNISGLQGLLNFYYETKETIAPLPKLVDGNELMELFSLKPSPILGKILTEIKEAQLNGDVNTKSDAIRYARIILEGEKL